MRGYRLGLECDVSWIESQEGAIASQVAQERPWEVPTRDASLAGCRGFAGRLSSLAILLVAAAFLIAPRLAVAQAGLEELGQNIHTFEHIAQGPEVLAESGVTWVRLVAWWKWMEPAQGVFDFGEMDEKVQSALDHGLSVLIMFASIPPWANGSPPNCDFWAGECSAPPTSAAHFSNFAAAVVDRYRSVVTSWEVWNEPDHVVFWAGTTQQWVDLIAAPGALAIHGADPQAIVMGPSTYSSLSSFQQHTSPICGLVDAVSAHFYLGSSAAMFSQIDAAFQPWMTQNCNKPLWITETGIDSVVVGEGQQASEYVAAYQGSLARQNLKRMFIFHWCDTVIDLQGTVGGLGFVETEDRLFRPKRSFFEVQSYINGLRGLPNYLVARDTFANSTARPVGGPINGTQSEVGGRVWAPFQRWSWARAR